MTLFALVLFGYLTALVYHLVPGRLRWIVLLAASLGFYASRSLTALPLLLLTALVNWACAVRMTDAADRAKAAASGADREERKRIRDAAKARSGRILAAALIADFSCLAVFKYLNDLLGLVGASPLGLLLPLGISFYTFQSAGYLIDVHAGKVRAERNPFRFLLFVSFFPQMLQGPIARFDRLNPQLREPHAFDMDGLVRGTLLIVWGLFRKLVVADRLLPLVESAFAGPGSGSVALVGVLAYAVQQYCDFAGGIDLVTGIAELFGIRLAENFRRPYFSVSLADFWRRWHISLGSWMRDYVFYPFAVTRPVQRLSKAAGGRFGKAFARALPAALGNLLVFFLVGLWHGAAPNYIAWGLYNGVILAADALLEPVYKRWNERHARLSASKGFHVFRVLRTFAVVNVGWFFDRSARVTDAFAMMGSVLARFDGGAVNAAFLEAAGLARPELIVLLCSVALVFLASLLRENGRDIRGAIVRLPLPLRWAFLILAISSVLVFGVWGSGFDEAAFIYNGF